ncbi:putative redoxin family protein [Neofusicoccum parvum]|nr:putative redoxin family protein [Neofusicoccum parvum]
MEHQTQQPYDRTSEDVYPPGLPKPVDDHKCDHLWGMDVPSVPLVSTDGKTVDVSKLKGFTVVFCYPRTGRPKEPVPSDWDAIPGARGCTPQACSFKAATSQLKGLQISNIFGLSTQDTEHQKICQEHLRLNYHLISDEHFAFCEALRLPMFEWGNMRLVKRVTLLLDHGKIVWVDYPVFPADKSAERVVEHMKKQPINGSSSGRCGNEASTSSEPLASPPALPRQTSGHVSKSPDATRSPLPPPMSPVEHVGSPKKHHGPASNFHPCQDWIDKKAREAKNQMSRNVSGDVNLGQDDAGKKYSFHFSGGCTTN